MGRTPISFFFCLRISELLVLSSNDVSFVDEPSGLVLSILIRSSKTDQVRMGVTRTLHTNPSDMCPVKSLYNFLEWKKVNHPSAPTAFFGENFRARLVYATKWAALANGVPTSVVNTHSMRAGGATALFSSGVDWIAIHRWGRWRSFIFQEYIRRDASAFMHLGERIASSTGLTKFLVEVAPRHKPNLKELPHTFQTGGYGGDNCSNPFVFNFTPFIGLPASSRNAFPLMNVYLAPRIPLGALFRLWGSPSYPVLKFTSLHVRGMEFTIDSTVYRFPLDDFNSHMSPTVYTLQMDRTRFPIPIWFIILLDFWCDASTFNGVNQFYVWRFPVFDGVWIGTRFRRVHPIWMEWVVSPRCILSSTYMGVSLSIPFSDVYLRSTEM